MKKWIFALAVSFLGITNAAHATDGSSGCGPGWYILKDNSLVSSSLRSTTNGILFPVYTIGMTVGTSNCTQHKIVTREKESLHFATMNYFELKGDVARGSGPYLEAFRQTLGCNPAVGQRLNSQLKNNYNKVFQSGETNPEATLLEVFNTIFRDYELTQSCSLNVG